MASYPINNLTQLPNDPKYISHERNVEKFWKDNDMRKIVDDEQQDNQETFDLMDGPPFASSKNLHFGHLFIGGLKDSVLKYHTMHGKRCDKIMSLDCHGLPCEQVVMKKLALNTVDEIVKFGVKRFNDECKSMIFDCENSWQPIYSKIGRWCDFSKTYKTLDTNFMESVWHTYKEIHKKGLTYKGYKVMPYSTALECPLSNFEAGENYKEKTTNSAYVCFDVSEFSEKLSGAKLVAWTTTPWSLLSNVALCVSPSAEYVLVEDNKGEKYIVAKNSVNNLKLNIVSTSDIGKGKELIGLKYKPLFNFLDFEYYKVLADPYVKDSIEIGTGIVHISPVHGEDDCRVCLDNGVLTSKNLSEVCLVNSQGKYSEKSGEYSGMYVFDADKKILKFLKEHGKVVRTQEYKHQYPYCYLTDTPLMYMAVSSYFIEVSRIKDRMVELNEKITWTNKSIGEKQFKNWVQNAKDWCVSRNRFFGNPIPIWESEDETESVTIGSIDELVSLAKLCYRPTDIHLESIQDIEIISESGKVMKHCGLVFDCWMESASVPHAQLHYPFENTIFFDNKEFMSDFVCEGKDQTRLWFYCLLVISTVLFDKPPFKTVICSGNILDESGQKFSKKYGNYVDPNLLIDKYGADTLRIMMLKSQLINGDPLLFKVADVKDTLQRLTPYINAVKFFLEHYLNSQKKEDPIIIDYLADPDEYGTNNFTLMDLWILEDVYLLRKNVETYMKDYKIDFAVKAILDFVENLANWYVKFNRDRMKGLCGKTAYEKSLSVLFTVLFDYCVISAPFMPFLSEHIYQYLGILIPDSKYCTVHLEGYPDCERKHNVVESFSQLQKLSKVLRFARDTSKTHLSVRVPIKKCTIYYSDEDVAKRIAELVPMIEDEINCQKFDYVKMENNLMLVYTIKPNFKELGQTYKKSVKTIVDELTKLTKPTLVNLHNGTQDSVTIDLEDTMIVLDKKYFEVVVAVQMNSENENENIKNIASDGLMVSIDMTYDEESHNTCQLKNLMAFVQNCRKEMKLNPWNNIRLKYCLEEDDEQFLQLLESGKSDIVKKLGTQFVKLNVIDSSKLFLFRQFKSDKDVKVLVLVEVVPDMAKTY
jgi:isoleucyl-tRNA synthetase